MFTEFFGLKTTEGLNLPGFSGKMGDMTVFLRDNVEAKNVLRREVEDKNWVKIQLVAGLIRIIGSEKKLEDVNTDDAERFGSAVKDFCAREGNGDLAFLFATTLFLFTCGEGWSSELGSDLEEEWKVWAYDVMMKRMREVENGSDDDKKIVAERMSSILQRSDDEAMHPTFVLDDRIDQLSDLFEETGLSLIAKNVQQERIEEIGKAISARQEQ